MIGRLFRGRAGGDAGRAEVGAAKAARPTTPAGPVGPVGSIGPVGLFDAAMPASTATRVSAAEAPRMPAARVAAGFAVLALALLALEFTDVDMQLQRMLYDPAGTAFIWRGDMRVEFWLHQQLKRLLYLLPVLALLGWWRASRLSAGRVGVRRWRYLFVALLAAPLVVTLAKDLTNRPCPWDVAEFGGQQQRQHGLFVPAPPGSRRLACFPAGHASAGFALLAFALAGGWPGLLRPARPGRAPGWWLAGLALGSLMGAVRMAQGAHFLSHVLWCGWLVALVQWALARWLLGPGGEAGEAAG